MVRGGATVMLAGLLSACGGVADVQILTGTVDRASLAAPAVTVRAWRDGALIATAPVAAVDGAFALAVPVGPTMTADLETTLGALTIEPLEVVLCRPQPPVELGRIVAPLSCPDPSCPRLADALSACELEAEAECAPVLDALELCRERERLTCQSVRDAFDACVTAGGDCLEEGRALNACTQNLGCWELEDMYRWQCSARCEPERQRYEDLCASPSPCGPPGAPPTHLVVETPMPLLIGCDDDTRGPASLALRPEGSG